MTCPESVNVQHTICSMCCKKLSGFDFNFILSGLITWHCPICSKEDNTSTTTTTTTTGAVRVTRSSFNGNNTRESAVLETTRATRSSSNDPHRPPAINTSSTTSEKRSSSSLSNTRCCILCNRRECSSPIGHLTLRLEPHMFVHQVCTREVFLVVVSNNHLLFNGV